MVIKTPQLHCFPQSLATKFFDVAKCNVPEWEISVPRRDDIAWSIVLSYLLSKNCSEKQIIPKRKKKKGKREGKKRAPDTFREDFQNRLKVLTGSDEDVKSISRAIRFFNPFRNRYSCFYDDVLKKVIRKFKEQLNWNALFTVSDKLLASADLLNCQILLLEENDSNETFRVYAAKRNKSWGTITLLSSSIGTDEEVQSPGKVYNFMLSKKFGYKLRSSALKYFLREAEISQKLICNIMSLDEEEHFLISVLNSAFRTVLLDIYKSPYIVSRLAEAGYQIDPRTTDVEGMSALYHALRCGNTEVLYKLYYFAANSCFESEGSFRNPDSHIVSNLLHLENTLLSDLSKSNNFERCENREKLQKIFDELLVLNKFLVEINKRVLNVNSKLNYYESVKENVFEAHKKRDIIVSVLSTYEKFFIYKKQENLSLLEGLILHKDYYYSVDMISAIQFFDNIVYLKEKLSLENKSMFSEIESCFFFSVLFSVVFDKVDLLKLAKKQSLGVDVNTFYGFQLMKRIDTYNRMMKFGEILQKTDIHQDNIVENIPEDEIYSILNSYPEIKDLLLLDKLKHYLKTASKVKVIDLKSVLVIQRVLHVIGEYVTPETEKDCSLRQFLKSYLPKEISHILHRIRHEMSHLKGHAFPAKFEFEKNFPIFKSIQKEIFCIQRYIRPIYRVYLLINTIYFLEKFIESLGEMKANVSLYSNMFQDPIFTRDDLFFAFKELIPGIVFSMFTTPFFVVFKRVFQNLEKEIINDQFWQNSSQPVVNDVKYKLWPLKYLLELGLKCKQSDYFSLLQDFETLEESNSLTDLKENTFQFLQKCRERISLFSTLQIFTSRNIETIENSKIFLKILRGFTYLSNYEKDKIRKEVPATVKESIIMKEKLMQSIYNGFCLSMEELDEFNLIYLSRSKLQKLRKHYKNKCLDALEILKTPDPITELEEVFSKNQLDERKHKPLCDIMQFSEETRKKLWKLVAGQKKKIPANNLSNLLNRIQLMKKILIEDNKEILELWTKTKSEKARLHVLNKIVQIYLRNHQLRSAVEMLLFDCMTIFQSEKKLENSWIKSAKLYRGLNLRNVIGHGSPLLENLCVLLDPEDLPTEIIRKVIRLLEAEDAIIAILELYERLQSDYIRFQEVINSTEINEFNDLRSRILNCNEGKNYSLLLLHQRN